MTEYEIEDVLEEIEDLRDLEPNWNGYGAQAIHPAIIDAAKAFIEGLLVQPLVKPLVTPLSRSRLQLEWHHSDTSLEFEFESPTVINYLQWSPATVEESSFNIIDVDTPVKLIQWFNIRVTESKPT